MRGWTSFAAGVLLLALAYGLYSLGGFGSEAVICGIAAAAFFLQGAFGLGVGAGDGATGLVEFIQNPADAIVDSATDRLTDWLGDRKVEEEPADRGAFVGHRQQLVDWLHDRDEPASFDPDAAIARYLEQRLPEPPAVPTSAPAARTFGRKGL